MIETSDQAAFKAPPHSTDSHVHVFGPRENYPVQFRDRYEAPNTPLGDYLRLAGQIEVERFVFTQPSAYGTDNRCLLDAMATLAPTRAVRGLVDIDEDLPDDEIASLHERGIRGVRINTSPVSLPDPKRAQELRPRIERLAARTGGLGWCLEFLSPSWLTEELSPIMSTLRTPFILDHMGLFRAAEGIDQPGFRKMLALLEGGYCWIKLTGAYRISQRQDFADVAPLIDKLIAAAPERLIWGSDYPHLGFRHISSIAMFNLLEGWLPTEGLRRRVLAENPMALFGFSSEGAGT